MVGDTHFGVMVCHSETPLPLRESNALIRPSAIGMNFMDSERIAVW